MKTIKGLEIVIRREHVQAAIEAYQKDQTWDCLHIITSDPSAGMANVLGVNVSDRIHFLSTATKTGDISKKLVAGKDTYNGKERTVRGYVFQKDVSFTSHGLELSRRQANASQEA